MGLGEVIEIRLKHFQSSEDKDTQEKIRAFRGVPILLLMNDLGLPFTSETIKKVHTEIIKLNIESNAIPKVLNTDKEMWTFLGTGIRLKG